MALPGGSAEILRLAALLPLTPETTLLVAGAGARSAGALVSGARGCFASTFEAGPVPPPRQAGRGKVTSETLLPDAPAFRRAYHHHALLLEPFRAGGTPETFLAAIAAALRPGGQIVLLDLVAGDTTAGMARWLAAEGRSQPPPGQHDLPAAMARAGFTIHVMEDVGARQRQAVMEGWQALTGAMRDRHEHPGPADAAALVREAEAWLLRLRLMESGACRLLRWHATVTRAPV